MPRAASSKPTLVPSTHWLNFRFSDKAGQRFFSVGGIGMNVQAEKEVTPAHTGIINSTQEEGGYTIGEMVMLEGVQANGKKIRVQMYITEVGASTEKRVPEM